VKDQRGTEDGTVKVYLIVLKQLIVSQNELSLLSEAVEVISPEEVKVLKVDVLEQNHHSETWDKVLFEEIRDRMRTEFELEPILLFIYRYLEVLCDQFLKRECLSFDLGNLASRKVINDAEVSDTSITFEGILALPNLLQEDVDLVRRAKGSKLVLSGYF
jgi:hypothetical protein